MPVAITLKPFHCDLHRTYALSQYIQFLAVIASGLLFCLKDPFWGISAVCGGLAVALPNMLFMIFA
ncbi:hypothetical protein MJM83_34210, partial [Salmonella enterica subsp. enterica serovar Montevideo]|nr:hypothetical protein [Salmonella enterica subsp. enterica serovar Montevideo]